MAVAPWSRGRKIHVSNTESEIYTSFVLCKHNYLLRKQFFWCESDCIHFSIGLAAPLTLNERVKSFSVEKGKILIKRKKKNRYQTNRRKNSRKPRANPFSFVNPFHGVVLESSMACIQKHGFMPINSVSNG